MYQLSSTTSICFHSQGQSPKWQSAVIIPMPAYHHLNTTFHRLYVIFLSGGVCRCAKGRHKCFWTLSVEGD